jgi:tRNA-modifying protein YgfZ
MAPCFPAHGIHDYRASLLMTTVNDWHQLVAAHLPEAPVFPECALTDLGHLGLVRASGEDVKPFLQGQLTSDVRNTTPQSAQLSAYCSPKGRMLAGMLVFQRGDDLFLQLPADRLPAVLQRLRMFVLRAKVTLEDVSASYPRIGLSGACARELLPVDPDTTLAVLEHDGLTVIRLAGDRPRYELVGDPDTMTAFWRRASDAATQTGPAFWDLMEIRAGVPNVFDETSEAFVPQMANLQLLGGVSFTKGCYTGQEVVARMEYLGKLKRRMYRARVDAPACPARGTEIFSPSSESGQGAGRVVNAAPSPDGGFEVLAVLQISSADTGDVRLGDGAGPRLELLDLPYPFPAEDAKDG